MRPLRQPRVALRLRGKEEEVRHGGAERRLQPTKGRGLQPGVVPKNGLKPMTHGRLKPTLLSGSAGGTRPADRRHAAPCRPPKPDNRRSPPQRGSRRIFFLRAILCHRSPRHPHQGTGGVSGVLSGRTILVAVAHSVRKDHKNPARREKRRTRSRKITDMSQQFTAKPPPSPLASPASMQPDPHCDTVISGKSPIHSHQHLHPPDIQTLPGETP